MLGQLYDCTRASKVNPSDVDGMHGTNRIAQYNHNFVLFKIGNISIHVVVQIEYVLIELNHE